MGNGDGRVDYRECVTVNRVTREFVTHVNGGPAEPILRRVEDDDEYGRALNAIQRVCVDVLVFDTADALKGNVLLGKRRKLPHADWWVFGGGRRPRKNQHDAAMVNIERELLVTITKDRLTPTRIENYDLEWDMRQQAPQNNGCHTFSLLYGYRALPGEFDLDKFNDEYERLRWVSIQEIVCDGYGFYHPALVMMVEDLLECPHAVL